MSWFITCICGTKFRTKEEYLEHLSNLKDDGLIQMVDWLTEQMNALA